MATDTVHTTSTSTMDDKENCDPPEDLMGYFNSLLRPAKQKSQTTKPPLLDNEVTDDRDGRTPSMIKSAKEDVDATVPPSRDNTRSGRVFGSVDNNVDSSSTAEKQISCVPGETDVDDSGESASARTDTTLNDSSGEVSSPHSKKLDILSSGLRDSHQQQRRLMEQFKQEKAELSVALKRAELELREQKAAMEEQSTKQIRELKEHYDHEISRLHQEKDAAVADAGRIAAEMTEQCRVRLAAMQEQVNTLKHENDTKVAELNGVEHLLDEKTLELDLMQEAYESIETELLEAINEYEDKEEGLSNTILAMEAEIIELRGHVAEAESGRLQSEGKVAGLERERDRAIEMLDELEEHARSLSAKNEDLVKVHSAEVEGLKNEICLLRSTLENRNAEPVTDRSSTHEEATAMQINNGNGPSSSFRETATFESQPAKRDLVPDKAMHTEDKAFAVSVTAPPVDLESSTSTSLPDQSSRAPDSGTDAVRSSPVTKTMVVSKQPAQSSKVISPTSGTSSFHQSPNSAFVQIDKDGGSSMQDLSTSTQDSLQKETLSAVTSLNDNASFDGSSSSRTGTACGRSPSKAKREGKKAPVPRKNPVGPSRLAAPKTRRPTCLEKPRKSRVSKELTSTATPRVSTTQTTTSAKGGHSIQKLGAKKRQGRSSSSAQSGRTASSIVQQRKSSQKPTQRGDGSTTTSDKNLAPKTPNQKLVGRTPAYLRGTSASKARNRVPAATGKPRSHLPKYTQRPSALKPIRKSSDISKKGLPGPEGLIQRKKPSEAEKDNSSSGTSRVSVLTRQTQSTQSKTPKTTSPKVLIQNVLKSFSPDAKHNSLVPETPQCAMPPERIELTPREPSAVKVGAKFESLFSDWSTAKKPAVHPYWASDKLPAALALSWSTAKKPKRQEGDSSSVANKRMRTDMEHTTPARVPAIDRLCLTEGGPSVHSTPLFVRNELVDVFSPEEMLLSPECTSAVVNNASFATKIQALWRGWSARIRMRVRSVAAVKAQTAYRTWRSSRAFALEKDAAMKLQSVWRGHTLQRRLAVRANERRMETQKRIDSACSIQNQYRRHRDQASFVRKVSSAVKLQSFIRGSTARIVQDKRRRKRHKSATRLQTWWRRKSVRSEYLRLRRSILNLQRQARERTAKRVRLHNAETTSAVSVQKVWRAWACRNRFIVLRRSVVRLQSVSRGFSTRIQLTRMRKAAILIQALWRCNTSRLKYSRILESAVLLQTHARSFLARVSVEKLSSDYTAASTAIQSVWRSRNCFIRYRRIRAATILIQSLARSKIAWRRKHRLSSSQRLAAVVIQRIWRGKVFRSTYSRKRTAAVVLQSFMRSERARLETQRMILKYQAASTTVQRVWRGKRCRDSCRDRRNAAKIIFGALVGALHQRRFSESKKSAVRIQSWARACSARMLYQNSRGSLIIMQSIVRGHLIRGRVNVGLLSITCLKFQAHWRGYRARASYRATIRSSILLQACVRGFVERCRYLRIMSSATMIQRLCRGYLARQGMVKTIKAAVHLQRVLRGRMARTNYRGLITSKIENRKKTRSKKATSKCEQDTAVPNVSSKKRKRAPLGDISAGEGATILSPVRTRRGARAPRLADEENKSNSRPAPRAKLTADYEKLKVVELRELLLGAGVEKKSIRNLRKAQLIALAQEKSL